MIVTLTANPSVDRTIEIARLIPGEVHRATGGRVDPGGKGVNVARALSANGMPTRAVLPAGGAEGRQLIDLLAVPSGNADEGVPVEVVAVPIASAVRANVTVLEPDGTTTKLNERGPVLSAGELTALADTLVGAARGADWAVLSGALPPQAPEDFYAQLIVRLHAVGVRVAVDTSGAPLRAAIAAGPDVVKPNDEELADAVGRGVLDLGDAVEAAAAVQHLGAHTVLASLGPAGAVLVERGGAVAAVHAESPVTAPRSTVGAGDAALAGFLHAGGAGRSALATAVAWGAAATTLPGSRPPAPADVRDRTVTIHDAIDQRRLLHPSGERTTKGESHAVTHLR
jgi:1-phosphofructokinase